MVSMIHRQGRHRHPHTIPDQEWVCSSETSHRIRFWQCMACEGGIGM